MVIRERAIALIVEALQGEGLFFSPKTSVKKAEFKMKEALPTSPHRSRRCAATIASHHHGALA